MGFFGKQTIEAKKKISEAVKIRRMKELSLIDKNQLFIICKFCGEKKFFPITDKWKKNTQVFCSHLCQLRWVAQQRKGKSGKKHFPNGVPEYFRIAISEGRQKRFKHITKDWLMENYIDKRLGAVECAKLANSSYAIIYRRLEKFNIPIRSNSESQMGLHVREKSPNWKGGISFDPYPINFNNQLKLYIKERDGFKCQICGVPELECERKLCVHHIDYNKNNISEVNLISLCLSCHIKTNHNREYWEKYFTKFMLLITGVENEQYP